VAKGPAEGLIARLETAVAADAAAFPALAEALRREGRAAEAERVARRGLAREPESAEGSVALGLALLDQGRDAEARQVLEDRLDAVLAALGPRAPAPPPSEALEGFGESLTAPELDRAFALAETDAEEMIDADRVAEEALHRTDPDPLGVIAGSPDSPYATQTMADLLERQGDAEAASLLRTNLRKPAAPASPSGGGRSRRRGTVATLERWLENLRRPRT
jgi:tetratricopeptide (TPR) repeat protein